MRRRGSSPIWLALLPASELPYRLEVDVEVVRGLPHGMADRPRLALRDLLEEHAHVLRKLAAAAAAESGTDGFVVIAAGTSRHLRQARKLFLRKAHRVVLPPARMYSGTGDTEDGEQASCRRSLTLHGAPLCRTFPTGRLL